MTIIPTVLGLIDTLTLIRPMRRFLSGIITLAPVQRMARHCRSLPTLIDTERTSKTAGPLVSSLFEILKSVFASCLELSRTHVVYSLLERTYAAQ